MYIIMLLSLLYYDLFFIIIIFIIIYLLLLLNYYYYIIIILLYMIIMAPPPVSCLSQGETQRCRGAKCRRRRGQSGRPWFRHRGNIYDHTPPGTAKQDHGIADL